MSEISLINTMSEFFLFQGVSNEAICTLIKTASRRCYEKGEFVSVEGKKCTKFGIVLSGVLAIQKISKNGEYSTIDFISDWDVFGEKVLFNADSTYEANLEAVTRTEVLMIPKDPMAVFVEENPQIKDNLLRMLTDSVSRQYRRIELLSKRTVREKILFYIWCLYRENQADYSEKCDSLVVELPVSKEVVSKYLAMPRPSFSRELSEIEKSGLIRCEGKSIRILDISKLESEIV